MLLAGLASIATFMRTLLSAGMLALLAPAAAFAGDIANIMGDPFEILDPEKAFVLDVEPAGPGSVTIRFSIEPGYYLYRKKMAVVSDQPGLQITGIDTPKGLEIHDEFFGDTEIYRDSAQLVAYYNYEPAGEAAQDASITLQYQGCADVGICYPPQEKVLSLAIPAAPSAQSGTGLPGKGTAAGPDAGLSVSNKLDSLLGGDEEELLPPDIAFIPSVGAQQGDKLSVRFAIEEGYYLYKDKIAASLVDAEGAVITQLTLPKGKLKDDAYFGMVEVYRNSAEASLSLANISQQTNTSLSLDYQGCADIGVCFPPQTTLLPVSLNPVAAVQVAAAPADSGATGSPSSGAADTKQVASQVAAQVANQATIQASTQGTIQASTATAPATEQDRLASTLSTSSIWIILATFFGLGLLLAFTPCVFPMVPILSSLIVGQGETCTTRKAFALSLTYVLAMAVTYTVAGVIVGLSGENIQIWFQTPWVLTVFALLFVLLSLSMFGFYELQMPGVIQQKLNNLSNNAEGGTFIGAGIMGFLSALIVGPCVTAPLVGALIFIADTGDALVGGSALFALSMGMGAPLLLIGTSAGKLLPRTGAWMEATKAVFGVLLLALAIWMLSRIVPATVTLALSAALLICSGIYLGATDALQPATSGWRKLSKGLGLVVLVYGMTLLVGALSGGNSLLQPLNGILASGGPGSAEPAHQGELEFQRVVSVEELQQRVANAAQNRQTVMLDFYADWCISCKEMEAFTFTDKGVQQRLENTLLLQADVTANNEQDKALLKKFGLFGPPGIIFYAPDGSEIRDARMVGFMPADKFSAHLDRYL